MFIHGVGSAPAWPNRTAVFSRADAQADPNYPPPYASRCTCLYNVEDNKDEIATELGA